MGLGSTRLHPPSGHSAETCNCPSGVMNGGLQLGPAAPGIRVLFWVVFFAFLSVSTISCSSQQDGSSSWWIGNSRHPLR